MKYSEYPMIMDIFSTAYSFYGYIVHLLLILMQSGLSAFLLISGILDLLNISPGLKIFSSLGLKAEIPEGTKQYVGMAKIGLSILLLLPLVAGFSYLVSGISCILVLFFLIYYQKIILPEKKSAGQFSRYLMMVVSIVCTGFIFYERADNLELGSDIILKALKYRDSEIIWQLESDKTAPKVGDMAPDFELSDTTGRQSIRLSYYRFKKPVVLIFGAHT